MDRIWDAEKTHEDLPVIIRQVETLNKVAQIWDVIERHPLQAKVHKLCKNITRAHTYKGLSMNLHLKTDRPQNRRRLGSLIKQIAHQYQLPWQVGYGSAASNEKWKDYRKRNKKSGKPRRLSRNRKGRKKSDGTLSFLSYNVCSTVNRDKR